MPTKNDLCTIQPDAPVNSPTVEEPLPAKLTLNAGERQEFGELIFEYSRAQAIAEGVLVDVSELAREAGFRFPVAMTAAAWETTVRVPDGVSCQDETGQLWDVLNVLRFSIATAAQRDPGELRFTVAVMQEGTILADVALKALCHPGDTMEPVITILMPDED